MKFLKQTDYPEYLIKKPLCFLFMDGVQLPQGYRITVRRQLTFYD